MKEAFSSWIQKLKGKNVPCCQCFTSLVFTEISLGRGWSRDVSRHSLRLVQSCQKWKMVLLWDNLNPRAFVCVPMCVRARLHHLLAALHIKAHPRNVPLILCGHCINNFPFLVWCNKYLILLMEQAKIKSIADYFTVERNRFIDSKSTKKADAFVEWLF